MINREIRIKIWFLIKRISKKLGVVDIPKEVEETYWESMKQPLETTRYLLVEHYNLDTDFNYHAYEEKDLAGMSDAEKMKHMFEHYFASSEDNVIGETVLLIDVKTLKAYTLTKEIKYTKKEVK